jgi:hypothetical protein
MRAAFETQQEEDPLQTRSKLRLVSGVLSMTLSLTLASCASRSREVVAPGESAAAPAAPASASRASEDAGAPREGERTGPREANPGQMRDHVGRLLELVGALARERDRAAAHNTTAEALHTLADAIDVAPAPFDRARVAGLAAGVRSEAARLARTDPISLNRADLAKAGLLAAARALAELATPSSGSALAELVTNAHDAARAIDVNSPFVFERARIQDAFRAAADAFLVFAERSPGAASVVGRR